MNLPLADITRFAATAATSLSVSKVLSEVIKNNIPATTKTLDTVQVKVGGAVLSFVIGGAAVRRVEELANDVAVRVAARKVVQTAAD